MGYILVTRSHGRGLQEAVRRDRAEGSRHALGKHDDRVKAENQGTVYDAIEVWAKDKTQGRRGHAPRQGRHQQPAGLECEGGLRASTLEDARRGSVDRRSDLR